MEWGVVLLLIVIFWQFRGGSGFVWQRDTEVMGHFSLLSHSLGDFRGGFCLSY